MPRILRYVLAFFLIALLVGGPIGYASYRNSQLRNFRVVRDGVLYRSAQLRLSGLQRVVNDYGIKTVITLRDTNTPGEPPPDTKEEAWCKAQEINYCRIPPRKWWASVGPAPVEQGIHDFLAVMADPANYPVLVHCCAGIHRTGAYCAIYRMEHDHWTNAQAIAEMMDCGYGNLKDEWDILGFLEQYRPTWQKNDESPAAEEKKVSARSGRKTSTRKDAE